MGDYGAFQKQEANKLRAEIERLQDAKRRALAVADERSKENVGLRAENERLRAALEPFANQAKWIRYNHIDGHTSDDDEIYTKVGDLRHAQEALKCSALQTKKRRHP